MNIKKSLKSIFLRKKMILWGFLPLAIMVVFNLFETAGTFWTYISVILACASMGTVGLLTMLEKPYTKWRGRVLTDGEVEVNGIIMMFAGYIFAVGFFIKILFLLLDVVF